jgi:hypothetical protein
VLVDPVLVDPVLVDPVLVDPVLVDPVLVDPVSAPPEVVSVGLAPPEPGDFDAGDAGVEVLLLTGVDAVALGLAAVVGVAEPVGGHWVLAGLADVFLPPVALVLAFADAFELAPLMAVALAVPVAVGVAVAVSPGLVLPLTGLPLDPLSVGLLGGLLAALLTGVTLGVTDLAGLAAADDGEAGAHAGDGPLLPAAEVPPGPAPPAAELAWVPVPFRLGLLPLGLELENPTAVPSWWTKAWRSGGNASATPMANTTQAAARAGRSSPYRQSRCCRGA